jgi:hypothetical protein
VRSSLFSVLLSIVFGVQCANATSVVAFWTPDSLLIAGDSLLTTPDHKANMTVCKVGVTNAGAVWGASGIWKDEELGFSLDSVLSESLSASLPPDDQIDAIVSLVTPPISAIVLATFARHPRYYKEYMNDRDALQLVLGAYRNGGTILRGISFHVSTIAEPSGFRPLVSIVRIACPGNSCPAPEGTWGLISMLGQHDAIDKADPTVLRRKGTLAAAISMVNMEIDAVPSDVGPPIAAVEVSANGSRWLRGGACQTDR